MKNNWACKVPRKCQINAYNYILNNNIGILNMTCGAGKTDIQIKTVFDFNVVLHISPRKILVNEHLNKYQSMLKSAGYNIIQINSDLNNSEEYVEGKKTVFFINIQSLDVFEDLNIVPDAVIVDEAHYMTDTIVNSELIKRIKNVYLFTATPNKTLSENYPEIFTYMYAEALLDGCVCNFNISFIKEKTENAKKIIVELKKKMKENNLYKCIVYLNGSHIGNRNELVVDDFKNIPGVLTLTSKDRDKNPILEKFKNCKTTRILVSCQTISMGYDMKDCDCVLIDRPGNSISDNVQRFMRCLRLGEPNKSPIVFLRIPDLDLEKLNEENSESNESEDNGIESDVNLQDITKNVKKSQFNKIMLIINCLKEGLRLETLEEYIFRKIEEKEKIIKECGEKIEKLKETQNVNKDINAENNKIINEKINYEIERIESIKNKKIKELNTEILKANQKNTFPRKFIDAYFIDNEIKVYINKNSNKIYIKGKGILTIEEGFKELLEMKNKGININSLCKEKLSNGRKVADWLHGNKKNLSREQLEKLELHILTLENIFKELLEIKSKGIKISNACKEKLSNGTKVGGWLGDNRKHLSIKQLETLELYTVLTLEKGFKELLEIKSRGIKISCNCKELLSNRTLGGYWLMRNRKHLSKEQLEKLELYTKLTLEGGFKELLKIKTRGIIINNKCKELLSNGTKAGNWLASNRKHLSKEQLKILENSNEKEQNLSTNNKYKEDYIKKYYNLTEEQKKPVNNKKYKQDYIEEYNNLTEEQKQKIFVQYKKQQQRGEYNSPNPEFKDRINNLISENISKNKGKIIVLDDPEFKTCNAILQKLGKSCIKDLIIPQRDLVSFQKMNTNTVFGKKVVHTYLSDILNSCKDPVKCVYADLMGPLSSEKQHLVQITKLNLTKNAVVAFTVSARDSNKSVFTNQYATKLLGQMHRSFPNSENIVDEDLEVFVYGNEARMATCVFKIKNT